MKISKNLFLEILQQEAGQVLAEEITLQQLEKIANKIISKLDSIDMSMDLVYGALIGTGQASIATRASQRALGRAMVPGAIQAPKVNELFGLGKKAKREKEIGSVVSGFAKAAAADATAKADVEKQFALKQIKAEKAKIVPLTKGGGGLGRSLRGKLEKYLKGRPPADSAEFAKDVSAELAKLLQKNKILVQEKDIKVSELVSDWAREYNINRDERELLVPYIKKWLVDQLKKKKYPKNIIAAIKESKQSIFEDVLEGIFYEV